MNRSECPTPEELAAFLDGRLSAEARRAMVEHLDRCPDCYDVFSESARFLQEDAPRGRVLRPGGRFARRPVTWAVASVAAVLLVLVVLPLVWSLRSAPAGGGALLATSELAGEMGAVDQAARAVPPEVSGTAAFGGAVSEEQLSFRVGARLLDLRVAAEAGDRQAAGDALDGLTSLATTAEWTGRVPKTLETAHRAASSGAFRTLESAAGDLEATLDARLSRRELALGKWTEAGWLAAASGDRELFAKPAFLEFPKTIDVAALPDPARVALEKFGTLTAAGPASAENLASLTEVFEALKQVY